MILLDSFDISADFFEVNPQLKVLFKDPIDSKIMWALFLIYHPESAFAEETLEDRIRLVKSDYLDDDSFDVSDYLDVKETILQHTTTRVQRLMQSWEDKLDERDALQKTLTYSLETFEAIDKFLKLQPELWKGYEETRKKLLEEDSGKTKGNIRTSLTEENKI